MKGRDKAGASLTLRHSGNCFIINGHELVFSNLALNVLSCLGTSIMSVSGAVPSSTFKWSRSAAISSDNVARIPAKGLSCASLALDSSWVAVPAGSVAYASVRF